MIVVDQKELNLSNPQTDNEKYVYEWMSKFRESKRKANGTYGSITLIDKTPLNKNRLVFKTPNKFDFAGMKTNSVSGIKEHWKYCTKRPIIKKNGEKHYPVHHWGFFHSVELSVDENIEMIFMLLNVVDISQFGYVVENKEEAAKKKIDARKAEYEVGNWITNKCTPEEIIKLSYRWGLNPEDKSDAELRDELLERVKVMEATRNGEGGTKKGFQTFIDEMNSDSEIMKIATYFYEALSKKKIAFNPSNKTCYWVENPSETIAGFIPIARWGKDKEEYIIEYLLKNEKECEVFMNGIEGEVSKVASEIGDYMMIGNAAQLRKWMKDKTGYDIGLIKLAEGKQKIKEFFDKQPEGAPREETEEATVTT